MASSSSSRQRRPIIIFTVLLLFHAAAALADTFVPASSSAAQSTLGGGYSTDISKFVGTCLEGTSEFSGPTSAEVNFDTSVNQAAVSELLGLQAGGYARFGAYSASASASFLRDSISTSNSLAATWFANYKMPSRLLVRPQKTSTGIFNEPNPDNWRQGCGDQYVNEIQYGARLLFNIRVDFASSQVAEQFRAHFDIFSSAIGASAEVEKSSSKFAQDTRVSISALQIGGDVSKLSTIFGPLASEAMRSDKPGYGLVECTLGRFERCSEVLNSALRYATDPEQFPAQLAPGATPGAAILTYRAVPYINAGVNINIPSILTAAIQQRRERLLEIFEDQLKWSVIAQRLQRLDGDSGQRVRAQSKIIDENIARVLVAANVCYENPRSCVEAVDSVAASLQSFDKGALELPPAPTASVRVWTSQEGLWSRARSVQGMCGEIADSAAACKARDLPELAGDGSASSVIFISGTGLVSATLRFSNRTIDSPISLKQDSNSFPQKFNQQGTFLVLESTSRTKGWRDIDLEATRTALWKNDLPEADGTFYLDVADIFGRTSRFDLGYHQWSRRIKNSGGLKAVLEDWQVRNRWWDRDSEGITTAGLGKWTTDSRGHRVESEAYSLTAAQTSGQTSQGDQNLNWETLCGAPEPQGYVCSIDPTKPTQTVYDVRKNHVGVRPGTYYLDIEYSSVADFQKIQVNANGVVQKVTLGATGGDGFANRAIVRAPNVLSFSEERADLILSWQGKRPNIRGLIFTPVLE